MMSHGIALPKLRPPVNDPAYPYPLYDGGWRFYGQTRRIGGSWPISQGDVVADVGCGHMPFPYATVLVDRSLDDGAERFGNGIPYDGRKVIEADIEKRLPFGQNWIDFSYCSHLLEHTEDPEKACDELKRVSKMGFIEVPNLQYELFWGSDVGGPLIHKWIVAVKDGTIIFRPYGGPEDVKRINREDPVMHEKTDMIFTGVFKRMSHKADPQAYEKRFEEAYTKTSPESFTDILLWNDGFDVFVEGKKKSYLVTPGSV
jgi:ubiquinone/menaquinone biosynthesis C-methylase UbiE